MKPSLEYYMELIDFRLAFFLIFALFIACFCVKAQSVIPQVNENVELMSILSRMAGFPEYSMDMAGQYIKDMDSYFKDNKE